MPEIVYPPVILAAKGMFRALDCHLDVRGAELVPRTGGAVLAFNHVSHLDFIFGGLAAERVTRRKIRFLAKEEIFGHPVAGPLMRNMRHIPVDRTAGAGSYQRAVAALRAGELVGMFPEATISRSYELKGFKSGAARMAMEAGVPLLPVVVWGTQRIMTKGRKPDWRRHTPITIEVGEALQPSPGDDPAEVTARLKERMEALHARALGDYPDRPAGDDDRWWLPVSAGGTAMTPEQAAAADNKEAADRRARREARQPGAG